jgi:hypothetical protein
VIPCATSVPPVVKIFAAQLQVHTIDLSGQCLSARPTDLLL